MHLICSPKFCITFVFYFSCVLQPSKEKLKTMLMENVEGQIRCNMGDVLVAYLQKPFGWVSRTFIERCSRHLIVPSQVTVDPDHVLSCWHWRTGVPFKIYPGKHLKVHDVWYDRSFLVHVPDGGSASLTWIRGQTISTEKRLKKGLTFQF